MNNNRKKRILIVAAHPDDEVLGCFGTVARLVDEGHEAYTLILGEGKTSRGETRQVEEKRDELEQLGDEIARANAAIGIREVIVEQFPDNRFDSVDLLDIVKVVSRVKEELRPDIVFTHYSNDLNIDHRVTCQAVLTATRPMAGESVREIYSFEILSSTEWNYPLSFSPDTYFDISETLEAKIGAMRHYASELRDFPHPRSLEGIRLNAAYHGMRIGRRYAEAFQTLRRIR